ncbi:hypothetical protein JL720_17172 [Aureococcus anophagefferens]|nr:hypothetical protein JL720_17172 [Aureococcus anophagefferens]
MMASYQDVTLTDAQTHEILCGFSTLLDARCVIVEAALARSKAFHRWRRSAAQPVVTPKGSTPKPTLATVAEAAEDATPRKRRPSKSEIKAPAPKEKNVTPRKVRWSPTSPPQSRSPPGARATPVKGSPPAGSGSPAPLARWTREPWDRPVRRDLLAVAARRRVARAVALARARRRRVRRRRPRRRRRRCRADSDAAAPEAPARRLAAPAGEADGAGFSEAFREAASGAPLPAYAAAAAAAAGLARRHAAGLRVRRVAPVHARARISPSTPAEQAGAFTARSAAARGDSPAVVTPSISAKLSQWRDRRRGGGARPSPRRRRRTSAARSRRPPRRPSPRRSRPSPAAASGWRCSLCYAQNEPVRSQCALCHQLKIRV